MIHRRTVVALVLLALVLTAVAGIVMFRNPAAEPSPSGEPSVQPQPPVQSDTLMVLVRDKRLLAAGSLLLGVGLGDQLDGVSQLFWGQQWWIDQRGRFEISAADLGQQPLGTAMDILARQTSVAVDDAWVLDRLAFAGLVDAVGGVRLRSAQVTTFETLSGEQVVVKRGVRTLNGSQAADYVMDASLDDPQVRQVRFEQVWNQILRRFPADVERSRTLIISLGALSQTTLPSEDLADLLQSVHVAVASDRDETYVLPLDPEDAVTVRPPQGVRTAYALDDGQASRPVTEMFAGHPGPATPIARVRSSRPRSAATVAVRDDLAAEEWGWAWGGRTAAVQTGAMVAKDVTESAAVRLSRAVGVQPTRGRVPLADADVDVVGGPADGTLEQGGGL